METGVYFVMTQLIIEIIIKIQNEPETLIYVPCFLLFQSLSLALIIVAILALELNRNFV